MGKTWKGSIAIRHVFSINMYIAMCTCVYIHEGKLIYIYIHYDILIYCIYT